MNRFKTRTRDERAIRRAAKASGGDFAAYQRRIQNGRRLAQGAKRVAA